MEFQDFQVDQLMSHQCDTSRNLNIFSVIVHRFCLVSIAETSEVTETYI